MALSRPIWRQVHVNSSDLGLRLKLVKLSANRMFTDSEFQNKLEKFGKNVKRDYVVHKGEMSF